MSDDEKALIIGRAMQEDSTARQELALAEANARFMGLALGMVALRLKGGGEELPTEEMIAEMPTADRVRAVIAEINQARSRAEEAHQHRQKLGV